jgi:hypothetical protein
MTTKKATRKSDTRTTDHADINALVEAQRGELEESTPPSPESVTTAISNGVDALSTAFHEAEIKVRGDNGKLYRIADDTGRPMLPEGTEGMAVEVVNTLSFIQDNIVSVIPWKLETMLERNEQQQRDQERQIAQARAMVNTGKADQSLLDSREYFQSQLQYQAVLLQVAFDAACNTHNDVLGKPYLTRVEREAAAIAARRAADQTGSRPVANSRIARFNAA